MDIDIINFIHKANGMTEEFNRLKELEYKLVRANGNNLKAVALRYKALESQEIAIMKQFEYECINLILTEKALGEIYEEINEKENQNE